MNAASELAANLRRKQATLKAQISALNARQVRGWLAAKLLQCLSLSRDQIRGGRALVKRNGVWYVPLWLPIAIAMLLASSPLLDDAARIAGRLSASAIQFISGARQVELAPFFAPAVRHWSGEINRWAGQHDVDPHLLATVMQIESCGHPKVVSNAGARGLFQVMPFHFAAGEDMLNPDINARRGANFLKTCSGASDGVVGLTLACYNGGQSVISKPREGWSKETQKYFRWGVGIYSDAIAGAANSDTFDQWIAAGGGRLCSSALAEVNG